VGDPRHRPHGRVGRSHGQRDLEEAHRLSPLGDRRHHQEPVISLFDHHVLAPQRLLAKAAIEGQYDREVLPLLTAAGPGTARHA
jgi:hypothetical protein